MEKQDQRESCSRFVGSDQTSRADQHCPCPSQTETMNSPLLASAPASVQCHRLHLREPSGDTSLSNRDTCKVAGDGTEELEALGRAGVTELHALQRPLENQQSALPAF